MADEVMIKCQQLHHDSAQRLCCPNPPPQAWWWPCLRSDWTLAAMPTRKTPPRRAASGHSVGGSGSRRLRATASAPTTTLRPTVQHGLSHRSSRMTNTSHASNASVSSRGTLKSRLSAAVLRQASKASILTFLPPDEAAEVEEPHTYAGCEVCTPDKHRRRWRHRVPPPAKPKDRAALARAAMRAARTGAPAVDPNSLLRRPQEELDDEIYRLHSDASTWGWGRWGWVVRLTCVGFVPRPRAPEPKLVRRCGQGS